jgi:hypothetical protein
MSYVVVFLKDDGSDDEIMVLTQAKQFAIDTLKRKKIPIVSDLAGKVVSHLMFPHKINRTDTVLICDSIDQSTESTIYNKLAEAAGIAYQIDGEL